jgi:hypothetical protein
LAPNVDNICSSRLHKYIFVHFYLFLFLKTFYDLFLAKKVKALIVWVHLVVAVKCLRTIIDRETVAQAQRIKSASVGLAIHHCEVSIN